MIKSLTTSQLLMIALAIVLFLLAAFSLFLLQDPSAPLPFIPAPPSATHTLPPPTSTATSIPTATSTPTRQTSYTPFATLLTPESTTQTISGTITETATLTPGATLSPGLPSGSSTITPLNATKTITPTPLARTVTPTRTPTLPSGEFGVDGRILKNGTPVANGVVKFKDDVSPRQTTTDQGGHYWFTTLAPGSNFTLTFDQTDNPQLTPVADFASLGWIEGNLPRGSQIIELPDFEIGLNLSGMIFQLQTPPDGSIYSATAISSNNPIQYYWTDYYQGEVYYIELGPAGSDQPIWTSGDTSATNLMWNGTLDNGTHITPGSYWTRVAVRKLLGNYTATIFAQEHHLVFSP